MENLLQMKKILMVLVIALMSTFSFAISLYHQQTGNVFSTQTDDSTSVNNMRAYAQSQINGVLDQIHLSYMGTTLNDEKPLIYYSIKTNDTIYVDYEQSKKDFSMLGSTSQSFHNGMFTDSLVGNKDGGGKLYIQLKIFATGNKMDTLGKVQIVEKTPVRRLSSNVFLTVLNGSEWQFDSKDGAFYAAQELTLTKSQRLALADDKRIFELEVLSNKDKPLTTIIEGKEKTHTLYSFHDELIGGELKTIEKENKDGNFEMTFMFAIHATKENQNLMGASHVHVGENIPTLQLQKGGVFLGILAGTEWTYNTSEKTYNATKTLIITKEQHASYQQYKMYVNVHDKTGKVISTTDDDNFFGLSSRHVDIKQGLGQVLTFSLNPDSSGTFDLKVMVEAKQTIAGDLGAVKLYANQQIGNFKKGDLYLVFNDGLKWDFDIEKQIYVANSTIPVTKEQFKNIFINDLKFIIHVHSKTKTDNILLSTAGPEQKHYELKMTDENMHSDTSYTHSSLKMKSDGSSELMVKVMIRSNEDLLNSLGMAHFHTMFPLNSIPKEGIFKAITTGNEVWFYDGVLKAYIFEKTILLNAQETIDYINKDNVFYVNVHDKAGKVIITSKEVDQISLFATAGHTSAFINDNSGVDITFFERAGKMNMLFSFYAQGSFDVSTLLGTAHVHTKIAMGNIAKDGVFIPVLTGTEWKLDKNNLYRAEVIVELTDEQLKGFQDHKDDRFYINVHNPQNGNIALSSNNPFAFEYKLYSLHKDLSQGYTKGNFNIGTDGKIMLNIEVTADQKNGVDAMPFLGYVGFFAANDLGAIKKGDLFLKVSQGTEWTYDANKKQYVTKISIPVTSGQIDSLDKYDFYLDVVDKNNQDKHILTSIETHIDSSDLYATANFTTQFNNGKVDLVIIPNKDSTMSIEFEFMVNAKVDASTLLGATHLHTPKAIGNIAENGIFKTLLTGSEWTYDDNTKMYLAKVRIDFTKEQSAILQADGSDLYFNIHEKGTGAVMLTDKKIITNTFNTSDSNTTIGTSNGTIHVITNDNALVTVYDVLGRSLISTTIEGSAEINTNGLVGTYIVVIESTTKTIREKVILD